MHSVPTPHAACARSCTAAPRKVAARRLLARLHQEQTLSSRISSARRSPGFRRRVRALHGVAERSPAWASVGAHQWPGRSAASGITVIDVDVRSAQTHSRWARCPATDFVELLGARSVQIYSGSRAQSELLASQRAGMCKRNGCFKVKLDENIYGYRGPNWSEAT